MGNIRIVLLTLALITFSSCSVSGKSEPSAKKELTKEEVQAAWEKSMSKSEEHKILEDLSGSWNASVKFWPQPSSPPKVSSAKSINKSILNGKFLVEDYQGSFAGKPFQGMSVMGYDTILKTFSNYWADNMGTGAIYSEGNYDPATNTISLKGDVTDPISQIKRPTYSSIKIIDKDSHVLEMYDVLPGGKKFKTLEIDYKRTS